MIKNVIFDVGNVLVAFCWEKALHEMGFDGEVFEAVANATVRTPVWNEFDRGEWSEEEILQAFIGNAPEYEREICRFFERIEQTIEPYDYSRTWIQGLMEKGYKTYVLSNFPRRIYERGRDKLAFEQDLSGAVFSYTVKTVKPEEKIYRILMERYHLDAAECVFIDDRQDNLDAAARLGMKTILFTDYHKACEKLRLLGVE